MKHHLKFGLALSLAGCIGQAMAAEDAGSAYREGYNLVLAQKWEEARAYFGSFRERWQDSEFADDAGYWHCYSAEQLSSAPEDNFACYRDFIVQFRDSSSNWLDDAQDRMMMVAGNLASQGRPQFIADALQYFEVPVPDFDLPGLPPVPGLNGAELALTISQAMEDVRMAFEDGFESGEWARNFNIGNRGRSAVDSELLALISALQDDPRAGDLLINRLEQTEDPAVQARLVLMLQDLQGEQVTGKLIDMARNSPHEQVQRNAILALLDRKDAASQALLADVLASDAFPVSARVAAVTSLRRRDEHNAVTQLSDLLGRESNVRLVRAASRELIQINSPAAREALIQHYRSITDPSLRRELLEQMEGARSPQMISFFTDVALQADASEAAIAVSNLAELENDVGVTALESVYSRTGSRQLQLAVIHGMGRAETSSATRFLGDIIAQSDDTEVLSTAAQALGRTDQPEAVQLVMQAYSKTADPRVKSAALRAMSQLDEHPQAKQFMLEMLGQELDAL